MRFSTSLLAVAVGAAACLATAPSLAGWTPGGVTVTSSSLILRPLVACGDGASGTFVIWQEEASGSSSGVLHAQHLLPTGDVDPVWPSSGANVCGVVTARSVIGAVPDRLGGVYVWWKESAALYVSRIVGGSVDGNWPARGRLLGSTAELAPTPSLIEDGAHGFYAAWVSPAAGPGDTYQLRGLHVGPTNAAAGGWPAGGRALSAGTVFNTIELWPQLALAEDGGVFVAWATWSADTTQTPGEYRLRRLTAAGLDAAGWTLDGVSFGTFRGDLVPLSSWQKLVSSAIGLSPDGRGGVFLFIGKITGFDSFQNLATMDVSLRRLLGDGTSDPSWPAEGRTFSNGPAYYFDYGSDASLRVLPDGMDGAVVLMPVFYDHGTNVGVRHCSADGVWTLEYGPAAQAKLLGYDLALRGDGGLYLASYNPDGPYGPYDDYAFLSLGQDPEPGSWSPFFEIHYDIVVLWYGDIALAPTGDGGAVFFWSQVRDRFGLFARRFTPGGEVTGVVPQSSVLALRGLRFVAGSGVRARVTLPGGAARLDLFDVAGRRVSSERLAGSGAREVTLSGTAGLRSGLYFARLQGGQDAFSGKVVVSR